MRQGWWRINGWQAVVYGSVLGAGVLMVFNNAIGAGLLGLVAAATTGLYVWKGLAQREDKALGWPMAALTAVLSVVLIAIGMAGQDTARPANAANQSVR